MGNAISSAANSVGSTLANIIAAPFKSVFNSSCEGICSSTWDFICFIEHLCVNDLARLLMVLFLCYLTLLLLYILFRIGIFQCIGKSLCKMCWAACEAYWCALYHIACFLCYKIRNTKRVVRRRPRRYFHNFSDAEKGYRTSSSSENEYMGTYRRYRTVSRKRKSFQRDLDHSVRGNRLHSHRHLRSRRSRKVNVSFRVKDSSRRSVRTKTKPLKIRNLENGRGRGNSFKRRRLDAH